MVNYIPLISFFIAILITSLGSLMQSYLNDIKKTSWARYTWLDIQIDRA